MRLSVRTIYACISSTYAAVSSSLLGLQAAEPLPPAVIKAIAKELKELQEKPEEGIKVCPGFHKSCLAQHVHKVS